MWALRSRILTVPWSGMGECWGLSGRIRRRGAIIRPCWSGVAAGVALLPARGTAIQPSTFGSLPHVAFRACGRDYEEARSELQAAGIDFRESDHKVARSMYLLDPDAHLIEITTYDVKAQAA
jgi:hypothetical protein